MRAVVYFIEGLLGSLAAISWSARKRIDAVYLKWFPSIRQFAFAALAFSLSSVASLTAAELGFHLMHFPFPQALNESTNTIAKFDSELGWSYVPDRAYVQEFGATKRKVPMYFDDLGCRVRAPGLRHNPSSPSVLFVGDSFTFGHGLPYEETFVGQLAAIHGFPYHAVNLGVQGYGTDQSLLLLQRQFKKFNAKAVVYTFTALQPDRNAVYDVRVFNRSGGFLGTKPLFALRPNGTVYLKRLPARFDAIRYSRLWACFQIAKLRWGPQTDLAITRALVQEMKNYVESNGATFVVIDWDQAPNSSIPGGPHFSGMSLNLIDLGASTASGVEGLADPRRLASRCSGARLCGSLASRGTQTSTTKKQITLCERRHPASEPGGAWSIFLGRRQCSRGCWEEG